MAGFDIEKVAQTYPTRDERHPYNIWGFKKQKKRPKHKKKKPVSKKKNGHIDIYA
jgi:hypothetical protein